MPIIMVKVDVFEQQWCEYSIGQLTDCYRIITILMQNRINIKIVVVGGEAKADIR